MRKKLLIFGIMILSACADAKQLNDVNVKQSTAPELKKIESKAVPTDEETGKGQTTDEKIKIMKTNLATQPHEIQMVVAAQNLLGDVDNAEDTKRLRFIKIEVESRDLNHDGVAERIVTVTEDQEGKINQDLQPVYVFAKKKGKWRHLNGKAEIMRKSLKFAPTNQKTEFDDIEFESETTAADEAQKPQTVRFTSINRYKTGAYLEVECRKIPDGKIITCPKRSK